MSSTFFSTGAAPAPPVALEFADGVHALPAAFVAELGGEAELRKQADQLKGVTFAEFMRAFSDERAARLLGSQFTRLVGRQGGAWWR